MCIGSLNLEDGNVGMEKSQYRWTNEDILSTLILYTNKKIYSYETKMGTRFYRGSSKPI